MALETSAEPIRSRFSIISQKTKKWIETMLVRLQPFIKWPGREELLKKCLFPSKRQFWGFL